MFVERMAARNPSVDCVAVTVLGDLVHSHLSLSSDSVLSGLARDALLLTTVPLTLTVVIKVSAYRRSQQPCPGINTN